MAIKPSNITISANTVRAPPGEAAAAWNVSSDSTMEMHGALATEVADEAAADEICTAVSLEADEGAAACIDDEAAAG